MTALAALPTELTIDDPADGAIAAHRLAAGGVVGHAFANLYAITARGDTETVRRVNAMKGRPPEQVGSITGPPAALWEAWDLDRLPEGLDRRALRTLVDTFFGLGPFGFRGPAAATVPSHLTLREGEVTTAQVIAPGYACPSNSFLSRARAACGDDLLYITSANRSRHLTGADDSPAHWRADGLVAEFGAEDGFCLVAHPDEGAARARYPRYLPMSTTILGFHTLIRRPGDPRPHLILERHGSMPVADVRAVLAGLGYGLIIGPKAETRLPLRDYSRRLADR
jgi:tRNA A37 threonylcarbamoyladenosine synthetase subunit TsaC/SUA5/YrdC